MTHPNIANNEVLCGFLAISRPNLSADLFIHLLCEVFSPSLYLCGFWNALFQVDANLTHDDNFFDCLIFSIFGVDATVFAV